ncbi:MAG TPA: hypothetical protein VE088_10650 [Gaiellaceae bacterium]|nr:hypothetical protein [Gaiellaceae bacterium]
MSAHGPAERLPRLRAGGRVDQLHVLAFEWTKLRSVRSSAWSLFLAVLFVIGIAGIAAYVQIHHYPSEQALRANVHPLPLSLAGVQLGQLAIGVLGVLTITAEYSTGMIRSTLAAVPKRLPVLWAKALVYAVVTGLLMVPSAIAAFFLAQAVLSTRHVSLAFGAAGVTRAVAGAGLYLVVVALFGLGLGALVRNTAGGIATFTGIMFVLPPLLDVLPASWNRAASPYLPLNAGESIMQIQPGPHLAPWVGLGVFAAYAAVAIALAALLLVRRDV